MRFRLSAMSLVALIITFTACRKNNNGPSKCYSDEATIRQIVNKKAVIKVVGSPAIVYLVEDGAIDGRLIPCNLPDTYYQNDLQVIISGEVKATIQTAFGPCCSENFVISKISR